MIITVLQLVLSVIILLMSVFLLIGMTTDHHHHDYFNFVYVSNINLSLERKYMFLLCNGILVFLSKTNVDSDQNQAAHHLDVHDLLEDDHHDYHEVLDVVLAHHDHEETNYPSSGGRDHDEEVEDGSESDVDDNVPVVAEEVKQEEEEEEALLFGAVAESDVGSTTEELNRKVEEFIWKMKEEIRIEQQVLPRANYSIQPN